MSLTPYLMTVALHAVVLSTASVVLVAVIRNPRAKAALALGCLIATAVLSWLTPLRPAERPALSIPILPARLPEIEPAAPSPPLERVDLPAVGQESLPPTPRSKNLQLTLLVPMLWAAGTLAGLLGIAGSVRRGVRWQRSLDIADEHEWPILHDALTRKLDQDAIRISTETISPCVTGFLKPKIVLPRSLLDGTKPRELAWALRHELTHLDGHDSRWSFAIGLIRSVFWWNPMAHSLAWTWSEARERTCDQAAAVTAIERADYGDFLVTMAAALRPNPTRGPSMAKQGNAERMKRRVTSLLTTAPGMPERVSKLQAAGCGIAFAASLGATSLLAFAKEAPEAEGAEGNPTLETILNPPPQLAVSMALLKTAAPFCTQGQILSSRELDLKLKAASQGRGIQLLPFPPEIDELGATSWAHLTSADEAGAGLTEPPWDGKTTKTPFVGWVVGRNSHLSGENVVVSVGAAYAFSPGYHLAPGFGMNGLLSRDTVRQVNFEAKAEVPSGKAVAFTFGEVEPGVHVSVVLGLTVAKPWALPSARETELFAALSPKQRAVVADTRGPTRLVFDTPEYDRTLKQYNAARKAWLDAVDSLPANRTLVHLREQLLQRLSERPEDGDELRWKLARLGEIIHANSWKDSGVSSLERESERLFEALSQVEHQIMTADYEKRYPRKNRQALPSR